MLSFHSVATAKETAARVDKYVANRLELELKEQQVMVEKSKMELEVMVGGWSAF